MPLSERSGGLVTLLLPLALRALAVILPALVLALRVLDCPGALGTERRE
jgi:hypothetical protein